MRALDLREAAVTATEILDALPIVTWLADAEGVVMFVSRSWRDATGLEPERVLRRPIAEIATPGERAETGAAWAEALRSGARFVRELRLGDDEISPPYVLQADAMRDERGAVVGWFGTIANVADRRLTDLRLAAARGAATANAREALASSDVASVMHRDLVRSEARFRAMAEMMPGMLWSAAPGGEIEIETHGSLGLRTPEPGRRDGWLELIHPDDRAATRAEWEDARATGDDFEALFRAETNDGRHRWQLARGRAQRDEHGTILRWFGFTFDVDDRRRADENREQLERLIDATDDFVGILDRDGRLTFANASAKRTFELEDDESFPNGSRFLIAAEDRPFVDDVILPAVERDGRWTGEFRLRNARTGALVPVAYDTFTLRDERGERTGRGTVARDLRERRRYEIGMRALADAGAVMHDSLDVATTIANVLRAVVREFATFCSIEVLGRDGGIVSLEALHRDPQRRAAFDAAITALDPPDDHPAALAIRTGRSSLVASVSPDWMSRVGVAAIGDDRLRLLDTRSILAVPIRIGRSRRIFGALLCGIDGADPRGTYTAEDVRFAEEIAVRAALAVDHARAYARERRIAVTLQEASLPGTLPATRELSLSADYRPGRTEATIGGDWYDAFVLEDGRVAITIGDVLGKGLDAAVTMGRVRQAMQSVGLVVPDPNAMLAAGDRTIRSEPDGTYATALAGIFDPVTSRFEFASAGHPAPIVRRPDGTTETTEAPGILLGLRPAGLHETHAIDAPPGTTLVFFTDGLVEATRDLDAGIARLRHVVSDPAALEAANPAREIATRALGSDVPTDDIAVLVARIR